MVQAMAEVISLEAVRRARDPWADFDRAMDSLFEAGCILRDAPLSPIAAEQARDRIYRACQILVDREERLLR